ncbi:MAG: aminopeptidase [Candidatus Aminicenantia bacterium]
MRKTKLLLSAERAIKYALKIKEGENFLLVTDKQKLEIAEALAYWAKECGAEVTTYLMTETLRPITKPTKLFENLIKSADVTLYLLEGRIEEKPFRGFMVKEGSANGRICMMPGITKEMMERLVNIDYFELDKLGKRLIEIFKDSEEIFVENKLGTKISLSVKGRKWENDNGDISVKGKHGNLPAGEIYTAPIEESFNGKLVISLIDDKMGLCVMEFKNGKLYKWSGKGISEVVKTIGNDPTGYIVGEFGIGTNKFAKICPNMLEAEKAWGTCHVAIGDSYGLGINKSKFHYDSLVDKVSIRVRDKYIIKDGKFMI